VSEAETSSPASATSADPKSSPFGGARPIDTHAKEQEIEEKRQLALRVKKEADDKAREEKKKQAQEAAEAEKNEKDRKDDGGDGAPAAGTQYKILSKDAPGDDPATEVDPAVKEVNANAHAQNGKVAEEKTKPKESARDGPPTKSAGAWRNKPDRKEAAGAGESAPAEPAAAALEEDGWSTVSKPKNNRRGGGNHSARAVAS
jgi:translation initiation factor 4B